MGASSAGKTSMRSIIFASYAARETARLNPTLEVQNSTVRFLGNLVLCLWDCGGQDAFQESYFSSQREFIFRDVAVLIFVFDVSNQDLLKNLTTFQTTVQALAEYSPEAQLAVMIHKMDLVAPEDQERVFLERKSLLQTRAGGLPMSVFATTIWDESLYKAWSSVVHQLVPNVATLENRLLALAEVCEADELVLFERASFLVIASATRVYQSDPARFEKISNIVKQFKIACAKFGGLSGIKSGGQGYDVYLEPFTSSTFILAIVSKASTSKDVKNPKKSLGVPIDTLLVNLAIAKPFFENLIAESS